jgi:hypothetical protein
MGVAGRSPPGSGRRPEAVQGVLAMPRREARVAGEHVNRQDVSWYARPQIGAQAPEGRRVNTRVSDPGGDHETRA